MSSITVAPAPKCSSRSLPTLGGDLQVQRTGIEFANTRPDLVDIRILVTNIGVEHSAPTCAALSAAPLGAFVPWRPLAMAPIPALAPGESFVVRAQARPPQRPPLGTPDRVPPRQLLVALGADDDDQPPRRSRTVGNLLGALLKRPGRSQSAAADRDATAAGELPADPFQLLFRDNPHWAGNLNIFIGGRAVERHRAQALRVYPGRTNLAFFIVGTGRDAYAFDLKGPAAEWEAALLDFTQARSFLPGHGESAVPLNRWIELRCQTMMVLGLHPPKTCSEGAVEVHVKQRSTGETAIVEFSLDPTAAGPGCYAV